MVPIQSVIINYRQTGRMIGVEKIFPHVFNDMVLIQAGKSKQHCTHLQAQEQSTRSSHGSYKTNFKDLAKPELLQKCLEGSTQNANESTKSLIWKHSPKTKNNGLTVVNTAVAIAVCVFNGGANTLGHMLEKLGMSVGVSTEQFLQDKDTMRILTSHRMAHLATREERRRRRLQSIGREEEPTDMEGFLYQAGVL